MRIYRDATISGFFVLFVIALLLSTPVCASVTDSSFQGNMDFYCNKALEYASLASGIPVEKLTVGADVTETFPTQGVTVIMFKVRDDSGIPYVVYMDPDGNQVDYEDIYTKELEANYRKYGKLEPDLYDRLNTMKPDDRVMVWIWLKEPSIPKFPRPAPGSSLDRGVEEQYMLDVRETYARQEKPVIEFLNSTGIEFNYASQYAPVVFAEVTPDTIRALSERNDVDSLDLVRSYDLLLDSAAPTVHADSVWNNNIDGTGVKVAVVEYDGIAFANPYLGTGGYYYDLNNPNVGEHATEVAGIIASTHSTYRGIANGVLPLYSANSQYEYDNYIIAATEWAINQGVNILQNSWGRDTDRLELPIDRYFDHVVWTDARTIVVAAGNNPPSWNINSPGIAYNVITVGAFDDRDTSNWNDDTMADYSCWVDPFADPVTHSGRRQKPEVVAPSGSDTTEIITTFDQPPYIHNAGNGTSFSAPVVAGEAALLMERQSWLTWWPECVKAIVMASAVHNIEDHPKQSDSDGVGGVDCLAADGVIVNSQVQGMEIYPADFPKNFYIPMETGQTVRAVVCWDNHPQDRHPPVYIGNRPSDFDLQAYNPSGGLVDVSEDYYDTYEIVQFTAQTTGTYRIQMTSWYYAGSPEYVGFAYCYL